MSNTTLMWQGADAQTFSIVIDATPALTHVLQNTVTDHPVERSASITDHVRPDPIRVSLTGMISNAPHYLPADHVGSAQRVSRLTTVTAPGHVHAFPIAPASDARSLLPRGPSQVAVLSRTALPYITTVKTFSFTQQFDRVRAVFDELVKLRNEGTLITVDTRLRVYEDMVIEVMTVPEDRDTGDALVFDLTLKQVITTEVKRITIKANKGRQTKKAITPAETQQADNTVLGWIKDIF